MGFGSVAAAGSLFYSSLNVQSGSVSSQQFHSFGSSDKADRLQKDGLVPVVLPTGTTYSDHLADRRKERERKKEQRKSESGSAQNATEIEKIDPVLMDWILKSKRYD